MRRSCEIVRRVSDRRAGLKGKGEPGCEGWTWGRQRRRKKRASAVRDMSKTNNCQGCLSEDQWPTSDQRGAGGLALDEKPVDLLIELLVLKRADRSRLAHYRLAPALAPCERQIPWEFEIQVRSRSFPERNERAFSFVRSVTRKCALKTDRR